MSRDYLFVFIQFVLFALYCANFEILPGTLPGFLGLEYACYIFGAIGILVIIFGVLNLNENLTPFPTPKKKSNLISNGIYTYVRHPIYIGITIVLIAYAFYSESTERLIIAAVLHFVFWSKSRVEEQLLIEKFPHYKEYSERTGRFLPRCNRK